MEHAASRVEWIQTQLLPCLQQHPMVPMILKSRHEQKGCCQVGLQYNTTFGSHFKGSDALGKSELYHIHVHCISYMGCLGLEKVVCSYQ